MLLCTLGLGAQGPEHLLRMGTLASGRIWGATAAQLGACPKPKPARCAVLRTPLQGQHVGAARVLVSLALRCSSHGGGDLRLLRALADEIKAVLMDGAGGDATKLLGPVAAGFSLECLMLACNAVRRPLHCWRGTVVPRF